jgi:hypothetical protein
MAFLIGPTRFEVSHLNLWHDGTAVPGRSSRREGKFIAVNGSLSQAMTNTSGSDSEMQRFESCRPSQPVWLERVTYEVRSKTAR